MHTKPMYEERMAYTTNQAWSGGDEVGDDFEEVAAAFREVIGLDDLGPRHRVDPPVARAALADRLRRAMGVPEYSGWLEDYEAAVDEQVAFWLMEDEQTVMLDEDGRALTPPISADVVVGGEVRRYYRLDVMRERYLLGYAIRAEEREGLH